MPEPHEHWCATYQNAQCNCKLSAMEALGRKIGDEAFREPAVSLGDLIDPMPGKIVVQVATKDEFTPGGLYIPVDTARTIHEARATQGVVVAIGGETDEPVELEDDLTGLLKIGDTVLFGKYTGTKVEWQPDPENRNKREQVIIMMERDVLAILRSPEQARGLKVKS